MEAGGRGLALTDEFSLGLYASHLKIDCLSRATNGAAVKERTAANIYKVISVVETPILTWNVFPLHPHEAGNPFSNRQHSKAEGEIGISFLDELCSLFSVRRVIAIGNHAAAWAENLAVESIHVRHPSYGGQSEFLAQMEQIYGVRSSSPAQIDLFQ